MKQIQAEEYNPIIEACIVIITASIILWNLSYLWTITFDRQPVANSLILQENKLNTSSCTIPNQLLTPTGVLELMAVFNNQDYSTVIFSAPESVTKSPGFPEQINDFIYYIIENRDKEITTQDTKSRDIHLVFRDVTERDFKSKTLVLKYSSIQGYTKSNCKNVDFYKLLSEVP